MILHEGEYLTLPAAFVLAQSYAKAAANHERDKQPTLAAELRKKLADLTTAWKAIR